MAVPRVNSTENYINGRNASTFNRRAFDGRNTRLRKYQIRAQSTGPDRNRASIRFISGGMVSLLPATIANLTSKSTELGARMGLAYPIAAFGALIGNPVAGACLRLSGSDIPDIQWEFQGAWIFAAALMLSATACLLLTRYLRVGFSRGRRFKLYPPGSTFNCRYLGAIFQCLVGVKRRHRDYQLCEG